MSILICATPYGGCGTIAENHNWGPVIEDKSHTEYPMDDIVQCPNCHEDHTFQLTRENIDSLTDESNRATAEQFLCREEELKAIPLS